jgi:hypothetical protein
LSEEEQIRKWLMVRKNARRWLKTYNAVAVGFGFKMVGGKPTKEEAIVFFVRRKLPEPQLRSLGINVVPRTLKGFKTDVVEVPEGFRVRADDGRYRPILGGIAGINFREKATGTLGIVSSDGEILSNNHVFACGATTVNTPCQKGDCILQPGVHGSAVYPDDCVAELDRWVPIAVPGTPDQCRVANALIGLANRLLELAGRRGRLRYVLEEPENYVDAAVAKIKRGVDYKPLEIVDIGRVNPVMESLLLGDKVVKRGRTTLLTRGYVAAVGVEVDVQGYAGDATAHFVDQVAIYSSEEGKPFSSPGDSGSVIVTEDRNVGGLLFAGGRDAYGNDITLANRIEHVAHLLRYKL